MLCVSDSIMKIGDYTVFNDDKNELGRKTFTTVWRGKRGKTEVAAKRVQPSKDTTAWREWTRQYVEGEVKALKAINHKNVVQLYDAVTEDTFLYLIMEYCELGSLHTFVIKENQLSEITTISFMKDVAEGVRCIHEKKPPLIYCDVKPDNLLVVKDSSLPAEYTLKMTDVGLARHLTTFAMCGPECFRAGVINSFLE